MVQPTIETTSRIDWNALIPDDEWHLYNIVLEEFAKKVILCAIGGGLAFSEYAGRVRNTKDLDLYIQESDKEKAIETILSDGFEDYFDHEAYDRSWIFRSCKGPIIVDLIWSTPNHRMAVDERWLSCGRKISIRSTQVRFLPPEELIWAKLYVLQRDRSDWPDLLNIIHQIGPTINWKHLLKRVGADAPLLGALLSAFRWMCPDSAKTLPAWLWKQVGLETWVEASEETCAQRAPLLDSRDWFGPKETL